MIGSGVVSRRCDFIARCYFRSSMAWATCPGSISLHYMVSIAAQKASAGVSRQFSDTLWKVDNELQARSLVANLG